MSNINWVKQIESDPPETDEPHRENGHYPYKSVQLAASFKPVSSNLIAKFLIEKTRMNLDSAPSEFQFAIESCDRWQVYRRLCELEISCSCAAHQPLMVQIENTIALVQLWSVMRQALVPRQALIDWLESCLQCRF